MKYEKLKYERIKSRKIKYNNPVPYIALEAENPFGLVKSLICAEAKVVCLFDNTVFLKLRSMTSDKPL